MSAKKLYVICNSHMDPIWLWRLREGRSTWLNTCRSTVAMMKKYPFLNFARSSSACYEWIEKTDPRLLNDIKDLVKAGRWELVGGWVEQSDTIITPAEVLLRQQEHCQAYFKEKFGKAATIGYSVDAFGQNAGLPRILNLGGMKRYVFMRPMSHEKTMPYLFRWRSGGGEVTTLRVRQAYTTMAFWTKQQEMTDWIDKLIEDGDEHQTFFFGIGDHGGGIYEEQLSWLLDAAKTRNIEFSTLEHYFDVIEKTDLPVYHGELTHHSPGCYAVTAQIKQQSARVEDALLKAEKITLAQNDADSAADSARLNDAWNQLLLNYFHDVYSGTCIKPAYDFEIRDLSGFAGWTATQILEQRLCKYGANLKNDFLQEGGLLAWNPLPQPVQAIIGLNTNCDPNHHGAPFNALRTADGTIYPLQWTDGDCALMKRANAILPLGPSEALPMAYICDENQNLPSVGFERQNAILSRLSLSVIGDIGDTWGHDLKRLGKTIGSARLVKKLEFENGPLLSTLRLVYTWRQSTVKMDITAYKDVPGLAFRVRSTWLNPLHTLKFTWKTGISNGKIATGQAASTLRRTPDNCEQPFIYFAGAEKKGVFSGFISGSLHSYDSFGSSKLRLTLNRPIPFAQHNPTPSNGDEGICDYGQVEQNFWLMDALPLADIPQLAMARIRTAEHMEITKGTNKKDVTRGDEWAVTGDGIVVLAQNSREFHLWNPAGKTVRFAILKNNRQVAAGTLTADQLKIVPVK